VESGFDVREKWDPRMREDDVKRVIYSAFFAISGDAHAFIRK